MPATSCICVADCPEDFDANPCPHCRGRDIYEPCPVVGFGCGMNAGPCDPPCECCSIAQWKAARGRSQATTVNVRIIVPAELLDQPAEFEYLIPYRLDEFGSLVAIDPATLPADEQKILPVGELAEAVLADLTRRAWRPAGPGRLDYAASPAPIGDPRWRTVDTAVDVLPLPIEGPWRPA